MIIGSCNGLLPVWHQAITWTNDHLLSIRLLGTKFSGIFIETETFSLTKLHLKMSSAQVAAILSWPQCVKSVICHGLSSCVLLVKLPWGECHITPLMLSQHWLGAVMAWCRQATNDVLSQCWRHMTSLGHNEFDSQKTPISVWGAYFGNWPYYNGTPLCSQVTL